MELNQLLGELGKFKKDVDSIVCLLKEISRLEQNRMQNIPQLKTRLSKLERAINQMGQNAYQRGELCNWIALYKQEISDSEEQIKKQFGVELEKELKNLGLSLLGQYPDLKAGLFTIELDFDKSQATIWYGPKQERIVRCRLSASEIANQIEKTRKQLGSHIDEAQFLKKLMEAYSRVTGNKRDKPVPIIDVLAELSYLLQSSHFRQDPRKENYKGYSRADFSYDLFRVHRSNQPTLFSKSLHLSVATRANTRQRKDFLWIPDDESGKGVVYSHLQFKGATS